MSKKTLYIFICLIISAFTALNAVSPAFAQFGGPSPSGPPTGFQPMAVPENELFMGYSIEENGSFELSNVMVVLDPAALLKQSKSRIPEGMLNIGARRLMLTNVVIIKNSSFNYDPYKPQGIIPKVSSFKAKIVAAIIDSEEMPAIPGKSATEAAKDNSTADKNEIEVKIYEKYIEDGRKIPVLSGTAKYNGTKYNLYLNFLPPMPQGAAPDSPPMAVPPPQGPAGQGASTTAPPPPTK
jgi:hypothetical protein